MRLRGAQERNRKAKLIFEGHRLPPMIKEFAEQWPPQPVVR